MLLTASASTASAATGTTRPDGTLTAGWALCTAPTSCTTAHHNAVNETSADGLTSYISTGTSAAQVTEKFSMSSVTTTPQDIVSEISLSYQAWSDACLGNAPNCDSLSISIFIDGVLITSSRTLTATPSIYTETVTGSFSGDNDLEVQFTRNVVGGGNTSNADDDVRLSYVAVGVTYTPALPTLSIGDVTTREGASGTKAVNVPLTLSATHSSDVTVNYTTTNGTATAPTDFVAASGVATIPAGTLSTNISVQLNGDTDIEPDEAFTVDLSSPSQANVPDTSATVTVLDDDGHRLSQAAYRTFGSGFGVDGVVSSVGIKQKAAATDGSHLYVVGKRSSAMALEKRVVATGALVDGFGPSGFVVSTAPRTVAFDIAVDATHVYVVGAQAEDGSNRRIEKRSKTDGSLDSTFGDKGQVSANHAYGWKGIEIDGEFMYVAGKGDSNMDIEKRRLSDGSLDTSFGTGGKVVTPHSSAHHFEGLHSDATALYLIGKQGSPSVTIVEKIAKTNGASVTTFGTSGSLVLNNFTFMGFGLVDGGIVVGSYESESVRKLHKFSATDGSVVTGFGAAGVYTVEAGGSYHSITAVDSDFLTVRASGTLDVLRIERRSAATGALISSYGSSGSVDVSFKNPATPVLTGGVLYLEGETTESASAVRALDAASGASVTGFGDGGVLLGILGGFDTPAMRLHGEHLYTALESNPRWLVEKRLASTGALVEEFGDGGRALGSSSSNQVADLVIAGEYLYAFGRNVSGDFLVEKRSLTTGALDSGFGVGGVVTGDAITERPAQILADGDAMLLLGDSNVDGQVASADWRVERRLLTTGALVTTFGVNGILTGHTDTANARDMELRNGSLFISGLNHSVNVRIEKRDPATGALVSGFGSGGVVDTGLGGQSILTTDDAHLYIATTQIEKRSLSSGALDTSFDSDGRASFDNDGVAAMTVSGADLYAVGYHTISVGGGFEETYEEYVFKAAKYSTVTGLRPSAFGTNGSLVNSSVSDADSVVINGPNMCAGAASSIRCLSAETAGVPAVVPLAAQDQAVTLTTGASFEVKVVLATLDADSHPAFRSNFKLQVAARSDTCDATFTGEAYVDVGTSATALVFRDLSTADGASLSLTADDPVISGVTNVAQTIEEANPFTNAASLNSNNGLWHFPLKVGGSTAEGSYCLRVVNDDGSTLYSNTSIAEVCVGTCGGATNTAPATPSDLAQLKTDATPIAVGGSHDGTVRFTATASDANNPSSLRLCVEAIPVASTFTGTETSCGSTVATSGSAVTLSHDLSLSVGDYHWQARVHDGTAYSSWFSFGGNVESAIDFSITAPVTSGPTAPYDLVQARTSTVALAASSWTNETAVLFSATADGANGDQLTLCVEVELLGTAFDGLGLTCGTPVTVASSPVTLTSTISGLSNGSEYHWRAHVVDQAAAASTTVAFGANAETDRDFGVDTVVPSAGAVNDGAVGGSDTAMNNGSLSALSGNWASFTFGASGPSVYETSIGTTPGGDDVAPWSQHGSTSDLIRNYTGLQLATGVRYYFNVRAISASGTTSAVASSNGVTVAATLALSLSAPSVNLLPTSVTSFSSFTDVFVSTNATNGYTVAIKTTDHLRSSNSFIEAFGAGTYEAPDTYDTSDTGFGFTSNDPLVGGVNRFQSSTCLGGGVMVSPGCFAPLDATARLAVDREGPIEQPVVSEAWKVDFKVQVPVQQSVGLYNTTIVYTVVPKF